MEPRFIARGPLRIFLAPQIPTKISLMGVKSFEIKLERAFVNFNNAFTSE
jgi:hypothetical protein